MEFTYNNDSYDSDTTYSDGYNCNNDLQLPESSIYRSLVNPSSSPLNNETRSAYRIHNYRSQRTVDHYDSYAIYKLLNHNHQQFDLYQEQLLSMFSKDTTVMVLNDERRCNEKTRTRIDISRVNVVIGVNNRCIIDNVMNLSQYCYMNEREETGMSDMIAMDEKVYLSGRNSLKLCNAVKEDVVQVYLSQILEECLCKSSSEFLIIKYCFQHEKAEEHYKVVKYNEISLAIQLNLSECPSMEGMIGLSVTIEGFLAITIPVILRSPKCLELQEGSSTRKKRNYKLSYNLEHCNHFVSNLSLRGVQISFVSKKGKSSTSALKEANKSKKSEEIKISNK